MKTFILLLFLLGFHSAFTQSWADSLDVYAREKYMPPGKFRWNWMKASLLFTMVKQYDAAPLEKKGVYLDYIRLAMDKNYSHANGHTPNAIASGLGMAFLYRVTKEEKYKTACEKIFADYLQIKRSPEGAVSHLKRDVELWDDTIFMIGEFLLQLYKATGDEKYLDELIQQISLHRDKLKDEQWGLWVHGYDTDKRSHCTFCGQLHWPDKTTGRSKEIWGRGNGWVIVTLSEALLTIPKGNPKWDQLAGYLKEMIEHLPELQNKENGHWYQLPVRTSEPGNFIESSCTAMFAYGEVTALKFGIVDQTEYKKSVELAYTGLRNYSILPLENGYLTTKNVCKGTCIGDKNYYLERKVKNEKPYSIGMFINFAKAYEGLINSRS